MTATACAPSSAPRSSTAAPASTNRSQAPASASPSPATSPSSITAPSAWKIPPSAACAPCSRCRRRPEGPHLIRSGYLRATAARALRYTTAWLSRAGDGALDPTYETFPVPHFGRVVLATAEKRGTLAAGGLIVLAFDDVGGGE